MKPNKNTILIIALLALVSMMIAPVSAETLTGTLGSPASVYSNYVYSSAGMWYSNAFNDLFAKNIEYTPGLDTIIFVSNASTTHKMTFTNATTSGNTTTFVAKVAGNTIGNGIIGYQRIFAGAPPVEQYGGYVWVTFYSYDVTGLTGDKNIDLVWSGLDGLSYGYGGTAVVAPTTTGYVLFGDTVYGPSGLAAGDTISTRTDTSTVSYSATKPGGLGITGSVTKDTGTSQITIYDGITKALVASEYTLSGNNFAFNVPKTSIIISMLSSIGTRYNSSILFAPTVTPIPTTTWTDTDPKPAGYTRTWFNAVDGTAGSVIYGAALKLKDVQNGSWKNNTAGYSYIDTLPNHTIDAYGSMTGYSSDTRLALPAADTVYELHLWSGLITPAAGKVNLIVIVTDETTGQTISGATVTARLITSATWGGQTGAAGTATFEVPNMTYVIGTASKPGYQSRTATITTTAFGPDTLRIAIPKSTVNPTLTATPLPGEVTPRPTTDPNDPSLHGGDTSLKAQEMMNWLAMNGMDLVQLCFLVTVLALLGVKFGK